MKQGIINKIFVSAGTILFRTGLVHDPNVLDDFPV